MEKAPPLFDDSRPEDRVGFGIARAEVAARGAALAMAEQLAAIGDTVAEAAEFPEVFLGSGCGTGREALEFARRAAIAELATALGVAESVVTAQSAEGCDIDHTVAGEHGGSDADNLAHLCRHHHRLNHKTKWALTRDTSGRLSWTTPTAASAPPTHHPSQQQFRARRSRLRLCRFAPMRYHLDDRHTAEVEAQSARLSRPR